MATARTAKTSKPAAKQPLWNLRELYTSRKDPKLERDFKALERGCAAFAKAYRGRVARLAAPTLAKALAELERIVKERQRVWQLTIKRGDKLMQLQVGG